MDLASVVAALASVGVRVSGSTPNNNIQGDSSRACPTGLAGPEPSGTHNDPGQHFHGYCRLQMPFKLALGPETFDSCAGRPTTPTSHRDTCATGRGVAPRGCTAVAVHSRPSFALVFCSLAHPGGKVESPKGWRYQQLPNLHPNLHPNRHPNVEGSLLRSLLQPVPPSLLLMGSMCSCSRLYRTVRGTFGPSLFSSRGKQKTD